MFEREEQCAQFFCCVERGYVPLKFAFVASAAYTHDKLALTAGYHTVVGSVPDEVSFLVGALEPHLGDVAVQLVELGPGNGVHAGAFYRALSSKMRVKETIWLFDYSRTLLEVAMGRVAVVCPDHKFQSAVIDLEETGPELVSSNVDSEARLFLLLGNTIGNVESVENLLRNVRSVMSKKDFFAFGYSAYNSSAPHEYYLDSYRSVELKTAAVQPLLMAGAPSSSFLFEVEFDDQMCAIVGSAIFVEDAYLSCGSNAKKIAVGEKIRCFLSRRFLPSQLINEVRDVGFKVVDDVLAADRSLGYVVCAA